MILDEQKHKNLYRKYYQGKRLDYSSSKCTFRNEDYFTTQPMYAYYYATKDTNNGVVTEYVLKNGINVFNAQCKTDLFKLHKYAVDNNVHWLDMSKIERLKLEDWTYVLRGDDKRGILIEIIKTLGYDGFFNYEYTENMKKELLGKGYPIPNVLPKEPAIGIFKEGIFIKVRDFKNLKSILSLDSAQKYKCTEQEGLFKKVKTYLSDGIMPENYIIKHCKQISTLSLSKEEVNDIVADAVEDFHTDSPFILKIKEEIEKYGHTLDTYNGQRIFKVVN